MAPSEPIDSEDDLEAKPEPQRESKAEPAPVREGVLKKRGGISSFYAFSPHYAVLKRGALYVYKGVAMPEDKYVAPVLQLAMQDITEVNTSTKGDEYAWSITFLKTKVWFSCPSEEEREAWMKDVVLMTDVAQGRLSSHDVFGSEEEEEEELVVTEITSAAFGKVYALFPALVEWLEEHDEYHITAKTKEEVDDNQDATQENLTLRFFVAVQGAFMTKTSVFCYALLCLNHALNGGVITMIPPLLVFLYCVSATPRPSQYFWHVLVYYTLIVVTMQYIIKLPAFCGLDYMYGIQGDCSGLTNVQDRYLTYPYVIGIRAGGGWFLSHAWLDIGILLAVGVHIRRLQSTGRWEEHGKAAVDIDNVLPTPRWVGSPDPVKSTDEESLLKDSRFQRPADVTQSQYETAQHAVSGQDYYTAMFFADFIAFLYCVLNYSKVYGASKKSLEDSISGNSLDWSFVLVMILQFLAIILDRVFYLTRSDSLKYGLQLLLVLGIHVALIAEYQMQRGIAVLRVFYLLKAIYFAISALQIKSRYPVYTQGEFLTRFDDEPTNMQYYTYVIYRACPFLFELRVLLDWACTKTSLDFYQWFKLEDVHGQLFVNKCYIAQRKAEKQSRKHGHAQALVTKILVGACAFIGLCILIWLPLIVFSNGTALMEPNPPHSATMAISLYDGSRHYRLYSVTTESKHAVTDKELDVLDRQQILAPYYTNTGSLMFTFAATSGTIFEAPPSLIENLVTSSLLGNGTVDLIVDTSWQRKLPKTNKKTSFELQTRLSKTKRAAMGEILKKVYKSKTSIEASFVINQAVPDVLHLPGSGPITVPSPHRHNLMFTFHREQSKYSTEWTQWWVVKFAAVKTQKASTIEVVAVSDEVVGNFMGIGTMISQLGVVGLYVSVVFVVGRLLRAFVSNLQSRIMFEDMEDVEQPLFITKNIYLAREEVDTALDSSNGDDEDGSLALALEEFLYYELIRLYRQPEKLYRYTTLHVAPEGAEPYVDRPTGSGGKAGVLCRPGKDI